MADCSTLDSHLRHPRPLERVEFISIKKPDRNKTYLYVPDILIKDIGKVLMSYTRMHACLECLCMLTNEPGSKVTE